MEHHTFAARLDCHYLLEAPETLSSRTLLVATLHGFSSNPEDMLRLTRMLLGEGHVIAALEGPSAFFLSQDREPNIGFSWGTTAHPVESVRLHHDILRHVFDEAGARFGIGPERRLLVGFSQPVGMNYRFAATHPEAVRGVIGICGGIPRNWESGDYRPVTAALLHVARREDEFYSPAVTEKYPERLRSRARDVEFHLLEGGHRFPSRAAPIAAQWIERVFFPQ
ncbi:MAG: hypothetical protein HYR60_28240 [Acidobacteria bacterium]|nr:hypothetical protein [Acidobacteriota bacterium]